MSNQGIEDVGYNEALQQIADIAADLPFKYLELGSMEKKIKRRVFSIETVKIFPLKESQLLMLLQEQNRKTLLMKHYNR